MTGKLKENHSILLLFLLKSNVKIKEEELKNCLGKEEMNSDNIKKVACLMNF